PPYFQAMRRKRTMDYLTPTLSRYWKTDYTVIVIKIKTSSSNHSLKGPRFSGKIWTFSTSKTPKIKYLEAAPMPLCGRMDNGCVSIKKEKWSIGIIRMILMKSVRKK